MKKCFKQKVDRNFGVIGAYIKKGGVGKPISEGQVGEEKKKSETTGSYFQYGGGTERRGGGNRIIHEKNVGNRGKKI